MISLKETGSKRSGRPQLIAVASFLLVCATVFVSAEWASATTSTAIHGSQTGNSQVYWTTARYNTQSSGNRMSISPYSSASCGAPTILFGARSTAAAGSSFAKTNTMNETQSSPFFAPANGNQDLPSGVFYLTTYLGPTSGCVSQTPTWYATLIYDQPF